MFAEWEGWNYLDSIYFCVTSLLKIGFGDFVPGAVFIHDESFEENTVDTQVRKMSKIVSFVLEIIYFLDFKVKLVMNFVYILVGMGIVAMCYYLLKEEVTIKVNRLKTKLRAKVNAIRAKMFAASNKQAPPPRV